MPVSQNQRIFDLVMAGHPLPEVANVMAVEESDVQAAVQDLTAVKTPSNVVPGSASSPAVVSGAAQQDATNLPSDVYVTITPHAGGTVSVAIGPTNAVAEAIITNADASLAKVERFRLPAGWWFRVTVGGSAAIASALQITG